MKKDKFALPFPFGLLRNRIRYAVNTWLFTHRVGSLSDQYDAITDLIERAVFGMEHFGREGVTTLMIWDREFIDRNGWF